MDNIQTLINSVKRKEALARSVKLFLDISLLFFAVVFINYLADYSGYAYAATRSAVLVCALAPTVFLFIRAASGLLILRKFDEGIARDIQKSNPALGDDLLNAVQLKEYVIPGTSRELAAEFIDGVSREISSSPPGYPLPLSGLRYRVILFLVLSALFVSVLKNIPLRRYFFPFGGPSFTVTPGDTSVISGGGVNIAAVSKTGGNYPYIFYRQTGGGNGAAKMKKTGADKYSARIENITDETDYYVAMSDMRSPKYRISVVPPTAIAVTKLEYVYPSYTGLANRTVEASDIEAPAGTMVKVTAAGNKKIIEAYLVTDTGEKNKMDIGAPALAGRLVVQNQAEYWIEAASSDGYTDPDPPKYRVTVVPDRPPVIEIISPAQDVVVSEKGKLKIVYSCEDDFGVKRVDFDCLTRGVKLAAKKYQPPSRKDTDEYELRIEDLGLRAGDVVQYRMDASDNDTAASEHTGFSKIYSIEVFSYDAEHGKIEAGLDDFRKKMLDILSKQFEGKKLAQNNQAEQASAAQSDIKNMTEQELKDISSILDRMKDDPLTTFSIYSEYKNLKDSLEYLKNGKMSAAQDMLSKGKSAEAAKTQDEIISELERLSTLADNIYKRQKMEDVVSSAHDMRDSSLDLRDSIEAMKNAPSKEQMKKLAEATEKISELMRRLSDKLSKMPQELPDEFVNNQSVKKIDFSDMGNAADALKNALDSGNFDDAIKAAEELAKKISKMLETFDDIAKNVADNSMDGLKNEVTEAAGELDKIIEKQQSLLGDTEKISGEYKKKLLDMQKGLLAKLAEKQAAAISALGTAKNDISKAGSSFGGISGRYDSMSGKMNDVLKEFSTGKIDKSKSLLGEIVNGMAEARRALEPSVKKDTSTVNSPEAGSLEALKTSESREQEILSEFANFSPPPESVLSQDQTGELQKESQKQQDIRKDTASLGKKLYGLSSRTSAVSKQILDDVSQSQSSMDTASKELSGNNAPPAVEAERDALQHLLKSKDSLQNSGSQLEQMSKGGRASGSGPSVKIRGGTGGESGFMTGFVKIPALDDYRPPKEFREEVMDALRKKYPEKYDQTIKEYYKRLIE